LPDDAIHAPNEKFDLGQFYGGIETMAYLYDELAAALADALSADSTWRGRVSLAFATFPTNRFRPSYDGLFPNGTPLTAPQHPAAPPARRRTEGRGLRLAACMSRKCVARAAPKRGTWTTPLH
jgi:hypothetical protein